MRVAVYGHHLGYGWWAGVGEMVCAPLPGIEGLIRIEVFFDRKSRCVMNCL